MTDCDAEVLIRKTVACIISTRPFPIEAAVSTSMVALMISEATKEMVGELNSFRIGWGVVMVVGEECDRVVCEDAIDEVQKLCEASFCQE